jgi:heme A synthase
MKPGAAARIASRAAALLVLALVFMAYLQPDLMRELSTRLWNCF